MEAATLFFGVVFFVTGMTSCFLISGLGVLLLAEAGLSDFITADFGLDNLFILGILFVFSLAVSSTVLVCGICLWPGKPPCLGVIPTNLGMMIKEIMKDAKNIKRPNPLNFDFSIPFSLSLSVCLLLYVFTFS